MELTDRRVPIYFRAPTILRRTLDEELALCAAPPPGDRAHWAAKGQTFHPDIVKHEAAALVAIAASAPLRETMDASTAAEHVVREALLSGHHPEFLFNMHRWLTNEEGEEDEYASGDADSDDGYSNEQAGRRAVAEGQTPPALATFGGWLAQNSHERLIDVYLPCAHGGSNLAKTIEVIRYNKVPHMVREEMDSFCIRNASSRLALPAYVVHVSAEANDSNSAYEIARAELATRLLRRDSGMRAPKLDPRGILGILDSSGESDPIAKAFVPPLTYRYDLSRPVPVRLMGIYVEAAAKDRSISILLDSLLEAWRDLDLRDDTQTAFARIVPLLDYIFHDCDTATPKRTFNRTALITAAALAVNYPNAHLQYISRLLSKGSIRSSLPSNLPIYDTSGMVELLMSDSLWAPVTASCDSPIIDWHRGQFVAEANDPNFFQHRFREALWSTARAIRARHQFAHHGDRLGDFHLLAVLVESLSNSLRWRVWARTLRESRQQMSSRRR